MDKKNFSDSSNDNNNDNNNNFINKINFDNFSKGNIDIDINNIDFVNRSKSQPGFRKENELNIIENENEDLNLENNNENENDNNNENDNKNNIINNIKIIKPLKKNSDYLNLYEDNKENEEYNNINNINKNNNNNNSIKEVEEDKNNNNENTPNSNSNSAESTSTEECEKLSKISEEKKENKRLFSKREYSRFEFAQKSKEDNLENNNNMKNIEIDKEIPEFIFDIIRKKFSRFSFFNRLNNHYNFSDKFFIEKYLNINEEDNKWIKYLKDNLN